MPPDDKPARASADEAIELLGQRWTIFILREVFLGVRRYGQIQRNLGIASNVLASRLDELTAAGLLARHRYHEDPDWYEYRLTDRTRELFPVILAICWGVPIQDDERADVALWHRDCGHITLPRFVCACCGEDLTADNVDVERNASLARRYSFDFSPERAAPER